MPVPQEFQNIVLYLIYSKTAVNKTRKLSDPPKSPFKKGDFNLFKGRYLAFGQIVEKILNY